jgi:hypothetical protein
MIRLVLAIALAAAVAINVIGIVAAVVGAHSIAGGGGAQHAFDCRGSGCPAAHCQPSTSGGSKIAVSLNSDSRH